MYGVNRLTDKQINMAKSKGRVVMVTLPVELYNLIDKAPIRNKSEVIRRCIINSIERSPGTHETGKKGTYTHQ
jgi:metal-responsive CopG/Arc/MetJ family transcriptional regulator